jgi:hypothetical protein
LQIINNLAIDGQLLILQGEKWHVWMPPQANALHAIFAICHASQAKREVASRLADYFHHCLSGCLLKAYWHDKWQLIIF